MSDLGVDAPGNADAGGHATIPRSRRGFRTRISARACTICAGWRSSSSTQPRPPAGRRCCCSERASSRAFFEAATYEVELSYNDAGATDPGQLRSALPPPEVDDEHVIWVSGALGSKLAPAVAGMLAGRARAVNERLKAWNAHA